MQTTPVILNLTPDEIDALQEVVKYAMRAVADSSETPKELRMTKQATLDAILRKLPRSNKIAE